MGWTGEATAVEGVHEREFVVDAGNGPLPGVHWSPIDAPARGLLLLGHGATHDKRVAYITAVARMAVERGLAAVAVDGPGHGARRHDDLAGTIDDVNTIWDRAGGTDGVIDDWRAVLDFVESVDGARPTGWWGLSMGTMMGLPVAAADPRIKAAVLGLMGAVGPAGPDLVRLAPSLTCPTRFLVQWDDELITRRACFELFDALGSTDKTLHASPGAHAAVPPREVVSSVGFLARRLG
jgi:dienelactone hydrolase